MVGHVFACGDSESASSTDGDNTESTGTTDSDESSTGETGVNTSTSSSDSTGSTDGSSTSSSSSTTTTTDDPETSSSTTDETTGSGASYCGDGVIDEGEECDGANFGDLNSCQALDIENEIGPGGELACDDDCKLDLSSCDICYAPLLNQPCDESSNDRMHALELNCALLNGEQYDELNSTTLIADSLSFQAPDFDSWRVIRQFGTGIDPETEKPYWSARGGDKFIAISTGNLPLANNGVLQRAPGKAQSGETGENDNPDSYTELPGVMKNAYGGYDEQDPEVLTPFENCHKGKDCSNTLHDQWNTGTGKGHDVLYFEFKVPVPAGTHSFALDFAFFSAEFPEWNTEFFLPFSDMAVIWAESEAYTGNVAFIDDGEGNKQPLVTYFLNERGLIPYNEEHEALQGTGFDTVGGSTGWLKARANVKPGEVLTLAFTVLDRGDKLVDTMMLLDNFQWGCTECPEGSVDMNGSCGVTFQ